MTLNILLCNKHYVNPNCCKYYKTKLLLVFLVLLLLLPTKIVLIRTAGMEPEKKIKIRAFAQQVKQLTLETKGLKQGKISQ